MNVKEAYKIIEDKYPGGVVVECLESDNFYAFALADKKYASEEFFVGGYHTVEKKSGKMSTLNPLRDCKIIQKCNKVDVNILNK